MKKMKRLLAITLSAAMICGVFSVIEPETVEAGMPMVVDFLETFSEDGVFDEKWAAVNNSSLTTATGYISGGTFSVPANNESQLFVMANNDGLTEMSDYTVSSKVWFEDIPAISDSVYTVALASRISDQEAVRTAGYELDLCVKVSQGETEDDKVQSAYVKLRDRAAGKDYTGQYSLKDFDCTEENVLEMENIGNTITCYVNNKKIFTYEASNVNFYTDNQTITNVYTVGTAGIRVLSTKIGEKVSFDDFTITHMSDHKFSDDFNRYDATASTTEKQAELQEKGWYVPSYASDLVDGTAFVIPSDNTTQKIVLQTENAKGALGWNDYSVEAVITIGVTGGSAPTEPVYAGVTGRHTVSGGNDGYEIRLYDSADGTQELQIYSRNDENVTNKTIDSCPFEIVYGEDYTLKAVFQDNKIYAYVDDVLYLEATNDTYPIGYAGICKIGRSGSTTGCGVPVTFDDFVVYDYDVLPATYSDNFDSYEPTVDESTSTGTYHYKYLQANGWGAGDSSNATLRTYAGYADLDKLTVPYASTLYMYLKNKTDAAEWRNYSVEATFVWNKEATSGTVTAGIGGRCSGTKENADGYYLEITQGVTAANGTLRIRRATNGSNSSALTSAQIKSLSSGDVGTIRMEFNGDVITGYYNKGEENEVKITYDTTNDTTKYSSGYAGLRKTSTSGASVVFDNFVVYDTDNPYVKEIVGDIYNDDIVNTSDTAALNDYLLGKELDAETHDTEALDVNKSGAVNIYDYVRMKRLVDSL